MAPLAPAVEITQQLGQLGDIHRNPLRFAPLVSSRGRHVCQVLLKLNLLLRRGIRGVGRLDGGIHGVGIRLHLSVHFVDVPDLIIEVRG